MTKELQEIIDEINAQSQNDFFPPTTEEKVTAFEKAHDFKFPIQYKEWLLVSDGGEILLPAGVQFYGIEHKPTIDIEDDSRPDDNYIVIGALAPGDPVIFKKSEERISIYNLESNRIEIDEIYEDFYAFLNDMLDDAKTYK